MQMGKVKYNKKQRQAQQNPTKNCNKPKWYTQGNSSTRNEKRKKQKTNRQTDKHATVDSPESTLIWQLHARACLYLLLNSIRTENVSLHWASFAGESHVPITPTRSFFLSRPARLGASLI